ncbi:MAG: thioredoxin [Chloroflexi bacterium]|nr:thioredoxin [Chloroflexota bacterium]MBI3733790.1 thioredoxin [Chloroflexota bacterium]
MSSPVHVSDDAFETTVLKSDKPVLVDFWAPWCGPCKLIAPSVEELARDYDGRALVAKVNTDDNPLWASRYGVMGIPTLIFFRNGKEVDRVVGAVRKDVLKNKLEKAMVTVSSN